MPIYQSICSFKHLVCLFITFSSSILSISLYIPSCPFLLFLSFSMSTHVSPLNTPSAGFILTVLLPTNQSDRWIVPSSVQSDCPPIGQKPESLVDIAQLHDRCRALVPASLIRNVSDTVKLFLKRHFHGKPIFLNRSLR